MRSHKEKNAVYYTFRDKETNTFYFIKKENTGEMEMIRSNAYYLDRVDPNEKVYKETESQIKRHEFKQLFKKTEQEGSEQIIRDFHHARKLADITEDVEQELETYLQEEIGRKKKRLKDLEVTNYSEDLYFTRYKNHIEFWEYNRLFTRVGNKTVANYL